MNNPDRSCGIGLQPLSVFQRTLLSCLLLVSSGLAINSIAHATNVTPEETQCANKDADDISVAEQCNPKAATVKGRPGQVFDVLECPGLGTNPLNTTRCEKPGRVVKYTVVAGAYVNIVGKNGTWRRIKNMNGEYGWILARRLAQHTCPKKPKQTSALTENGKLVYINWDNALTGQKLHVGNPIS